MRYDISERSVRSIRERRRGGLTAASFLMNREAKRLELLNERTHSSITETLMLECLDVRVLVD